MSKRKRFALTVAVFFLAFLNTFGQTNNFEDGFEDGDLTNNPSWNGDISLFKVVDDSPNYLLRLDGNDGSGSPTYLSTTSGDVEGTWTFYINLDFAPSGSNQAEVFLMSDTDDLTGGSVSGYAVQIGESSDDYFRLVRYDNGTEASQDVITGTTIVQSGTSYTVKVNRDNNGNWEMKVSNNYGGPYTTTNSGTDNTYTSASHFGVRTKYTSTRSDKFYFDFKIDLPPFDITQASANSGQVDISFNRGYDQSTVQASDFNIDNSIGAPNSVSFPNANTVRLDYGSTNFPSNQYTVSVSDLDDQNGETIAANSTAAFTVFGNYTQGDVIINEFRYAPPTGQEEYVELKNTSSKVLNLKNWELGDDNSTDPISSSDLVLKPDSFLVVATDTTSLFNEFGHREYAEMTSLAALNDFGGDVVQLDNSGGTQVDSLQYDESWGGDGVALERRSATAPSIFMANWADSPSALGGTPGLSNQVSNDTTPPKLTDLVIKDNQTLALAYSEKLANGAATNTANFNLSSGININSAQQSSPDSIRLSLSSTLQNNTDYELSISNQEDIFGNTAATKDTSFTYYEVSPADSGDVFINEFSYVPPSGSTEYVELYNPTSKSLNLQGWTLSDNRGNKDVITSSQVIVPPDSFAVIAPDNSLLTNNSDINLIAMSSFPALNNGGDAVVIHKADGTLLDSLNYTSDWGGDEVALERRSTSTNGTLQPNWGDAPNGVGTPGQPNEVSDDTTPPSLSEVFAKDKTTLKLVFSETVAASSAGDINNYQVSPGHTINLASVKDDSVTLLLNSPLSNGETYEITASNISDIFGNMLSSASQEIDYVQTSPADSGDVFINEFTYQPPSGDTEYIELYNPTSKSLDLQGWTLSDNRGNKDLISSSQAVILPDSFIVIAPDNSLLNENPDINLITMSGFPALNNSGDAVVIHKDDGTLLDSLSYTSDWGGDEVALERRSTSTNGALQANWADSPGGLGTPGRSNLVDADTTPPFINQVFAADENTIKIVYSELVTSSAGQIGNYQISPSRTIQMVIAEKDSVTLILNNSLSDGETYDVTASNISDVFGNTLSGVTEEFKYVKIDEAQPGDIVINEVLYNPGDKGSADFVEIYNTTNKNFELKDWTINDASRTATIQQDKKLHPGEYLVLTGNSFFSSNFSNSVTLSGFPSFNNSSGDVVEISNASGNSVDSLRYSTNWGGSVAGTSMERKDPKAASNDASNWQSSTDKKGYSGGAINPSFQKDTKPPKAIFSKILPGGNIEIQFNEFIKRTSNLSFSSDGQPLQVANFDSANANAINLKKGQPKKGSGSGQSVSIKNLSDVKGNTKGSTSIAVSKSFSANQDDIVINEIMYNPLSESDDNQPDQSEYIELHNTGSSAVSLEGLVLHDEPDENGAVRNLQPVSTTAKWVPSGGHVLIYADKAPDFAKSNTANFFDISDPEERSLMRIDRSTLSLASNNDAIYVADENGVTVDSVFYDESWQNPNLVDTRGISLERISPEGPSSEKSNWGSSVNPKGGTPNQENSIYQSKSNPPEDSGISFTPNPFSPDDDGKDDNLFINYKLEKNDYLIKIRIYDRYGRLVKKLADGKQAGFSGQLIWDGRKNDGSRNRIGIYIVIFEAYNSANGEDKAFKKPVVLARQLK